MSRLTENHNLPGTLVCVEGIDGSGKSTQLALLRDWLKIQDKMLSLLNGIRLNL